MITDDDCTIPLLLRHSAARFGTGEALVEGNIRLTHGALLDQALRMGAMLQALGVRRGDRVALLMPPSVAHAIAFLGCAEIGAIAVSLHVRETGETLARIARTIAPRALIHDPVYADKAHAVLEAGAGIARTIHAVSTLTPAAPDAQTPCIPRDLAHYPADHSATRIWPQDTAAIVLSSGTTGVPKGIMHSHATLCASAGAGMRYLGDTPDTAGINGFSTAFIGWFNCTLPFLRAGGKVVFLPKWDPDNYLAAIAGERITTFILVPTMWRMLLAAGPEKHNLSSLRRVGFAGEPMDPATMRRIREIICPAVMNTYGTTETGTWAGCTVMLPQDYANGADPRSVGRAAKDVEIRIIPAGGNIDHPLPPGSEGELVIRGASVAQRIWEQPTLEARVFDRGWWRSGDLAVMDAAGFVTLSGRVDDMIISGGINIMPAPIEEALLSLPQVRECAVLGLPHPQWGQEVTACIVPAQGSAGTRGDLDAARLLKHLETAGIAGYRRPRRFVFLDDLPKGNTGKVSRKLLRQRIAASGPAEG
ncbi:MAG: class I adenylate-forming enzyme family protein [Pararhodobacter sp.]